MAKNTHTISLTNGYQKYSYWWFMQDCSNSSAIPVELLQSSAKPLICKLLHWLLELKSTILPINPLNANTGHHSVPADVLLGHQQAQGWLQLSRVRYVYSQVIPKFFSLWWFISSFQWQDDIFQNGWHLKKYCRLIVLITMGDSGDSYRDKPKYLIINTHTPLPYHNYNSDIRWALWLLKLLTTWLFVQQLIQIINK